MGFRFYRRVRIAPGLTLNMSKRGTSVSVGGRGLHYTLGRHGARTTVGLPGTGLSYTHYSPSQADSSAKGRQAHDLGKQAGLAASANDPAALMEHLEQYSDHVDHDPVAQANLGIAASLAGDSEAAAFHLGAARPELEAGDGRIAATAHLVLARVAQGDASGAMEAAEAEIQADGALASPGYAGLLWSWGVAAWAVGDKDGALEAMHQLGQIDPLMPGLQGIKSSMLKGDFDAEAAASGLAEERT